MRFLFVGSGLCLQQRPFNSAAIGFLQIPPHDGHPCLWLTLPAVGRARDFHPTERALVGRTIKKQGLYVNVGALFSKFVISAHARKRSGNILYNYKNGFVLGIFLTAQQLKPARLLQLPNNVIQSLVNV